MEYILQEAQEPHLFVIRKQKREGPEKVSAMAAYYVLDGSIYQAPHLYNVIGSRVVSFCYECCNQLGKQCSVFILFLSVSVYDGDSFIIMVTQCNVGRAKRVLV